MPQCPLLLPPTPTYMQVPEQALEQRIKAVVLELIQGPKLEALEIMWDLPLLLQGPAAGRHRVSSPGQVDLPDAPFWPSSPQGSELAPSSPPASTLGSGSQCPLLGPLQERTRSP